MKFTIYIRSKTVTLCIQGIAFCMLLLLMYLSGIDCRLCAMLTFIYVSTILVWLILSYIFLKRRADKIKKLVDSVQDAYLAGEMLPVPSNETEYVYFMLMKRISASAIALTESKEKEKKEFTEYIVSFVHELKTPFTTAELILSNDGDANKLRRELKKAENITETLLYAARLQSAEKDVVVGTILLGDAVRSALMGEMELLIASGIKAEVIGEGRALTDVKLLVFILKQLLINCAKYCRECNIHIRLEDGSLSFEDNGPGIATDELPRIMDRGYTGRDYRRASGSTGMGLYIVKCLCDRLNIQIRAESAKGEFTRFTLIFPLTKM